MQAPRFRALVQHGVRSLFGQETCHTPIELLAATSTSSARSGGLTSTSGASANLWWSAPSGLGSLAPLHARSATSASVASSAAAAKKRQVAPDEDPGRIRVILRKDMKGLGRKGDVVEVRRGLMRHELYPNGDAAYATPDNVAKFALTDAEKESRAEGQQSVLEKLLKALNRKSVIISRRPHSSDAERFTDAAVSARLVCEAVRRQLGIRLHPSHLLMDANIDTYGSFKVPMNLRLPDNRQVELTVHVDRRGKKAEVVGAGVGAGAGAGLSAAGRPT